MQKDKVLTLALGPEVPGPNVPPQGLAEFLFRNCFAIQNNFSLFPVLLFSPLYLQARIYPFLLGRVLFELPSGKPTNDLMTP